MVESSKPQFATKTKFVKSYEAYKKEKKLFSKVFQSSSRSFTVIVMRSSFAIDSSIH